MDGDSGDSIGFCQTNSTLPGGSPDAVASDPLHVRPVKESSSPGNRGQQIWGAEKTVDGMALGNVETLSWAPFFHPCEYESRIMQDFYEAKVNERKLFVS